LSSMDASLTVVCIIVVQGISDNIDVAIHYHLSARWHSSLSQIFTKRIKVNV
jgi:hypothetical protein